MLDAKFNEGKERIHCMILRIKRSKTGKLIHDVYLPRREMLVSEKENTRELRRGWIISIYLGQDGGHTGV